MITTALLVSVVLAVAVVVVSKAWISYRQTVAREEWRTRRLDRAIGGTSPDQRPEILRAVGRLEGVGEGSERPSDGPAPTTGAAEHVSELFARRPPPEARRETR